MPGNYITLEDQGYYRPFEALRSARDFAFGLYDKYKSGGTEDQRRLGMKQTQAGIDQTNTQTDAQALQNNQAADAIGQRDAQRNMANLQGLSDATTVHVGGDSSQGALPSLAPPGGGVTDPTQLLHTGPSRVFGTQMGGGVDHTDEGRANWDGEAHRGAPIFGHQNIADPALIGAAISPEQAQHLYGGAGGTSSLKLAAQAGGAWMNNPATKKSVWVPFADVKPSPHHSGVTVEATPAAHRLVGSDGSGGTLAYSTAPQYQVVQGPPQAAAPANPAAVPPAPVTHPAPIPGIPVPASPVGPAPTGPSPINGPPMPPAPPAALPAPLHPLFQAVNAAPSTKGKFFDQLAPADQQTIIQHARQLGGKYAGGPQDIARFYDEHFVVGGQNVRRIPDLQYTNGQVLPPLSGSTKDNYGGDVQYMTPAGMQAAIAQKQAGMYYSPEFRSKVQEQFANSEPYHALIGHSGQFGSSKYYNDASGIVNSANGDFSKLSPQQRLTLAFLYYKAENPTAAVTEDEIHNLSMGIPVDKRIEAAFSKLGGNPISPTVTRQAYKVISDKYAADKERFLQQMGQFDASYPGMMPEALIPSEMMQEYQARKGQGGGRLPQVGGHDAIPGAPAAGKPATGGASGDTVQVRTPSGKIIPIPRANLPAALARNATLVQ